MIWLTINNFTLTPACTIIKVSYKHEYRDNRSRLRIKSDISSALLVTYPQGINDMARERCSVIWRWRSHYHHISDSIQRRHWSPRTRLVSRDPRPPCYMTSFNKYERLKWKTVKNKWRLKKWAKSTKKPNLKDNICPLVKKTWFNWLNLYQYFYHSFIISFFLLIYKLFLLVSVESSIW